MKIKEEEKFEIRFPIWKDYVFKEVFSVKHITKTFLEKLLGIQIKKLIYLQSEDEIRAFIEGRISHLDTLAIDENGVIYNIEMQGAHLDVIPYRYRVNGSGLDAKYIPKGMKTNDLKKIGKRYVIFICRSDPFDQNLRQYTVYNTIKETGMKLADKTELICLNAEGTEGDVDVDIMAFLNYVKSGIDDGSSEFVHEVHQKVVELNQDEEFVRYGMTLEQKLADQYYDGKEEGKAEGKAEGRKEGKSEGLQEGIQGSVNLLRGCGITDRDILVKIQNEYHLDEDHAKQYLL